MDYTNSNAFVIHAGTGRRMHQDNAPVTTLVSATDLNQIVWSLMQLLSDASVSAAAFDPSLPATYNRVSLAIQALGRTLVGQAGLAQVGNAVTQRLAVSLHGQAVDQREFVEVVDWSGHGAVAFRS